MQFSNSPKSVLCIHDLSGAGRCSLNEILPVLTAMGCRVVALPTTLLSTHTGGFGTPASLDCLEYGRAALAHYQELELEFDCIYAGYLSSPAQQQLVLDAFNAWPNAIKVMDPVLGDNGALYTGMEPLIGKMGELCRKADLFTPNLTEACQLLGRAFPQSELTADEAQNLAKDLADSFERSVVVTGISMGKYIACAGGGQENFVQKRLALPQSFPGTGDLFGAVLVGGLLRGNALSAATDAAAGFVASAISATPSDADPRMGAWYETELYRLAVRS